MSSYPVLIIQVCRCVGRQGYDLVRTVGVHKLMAESSIVSRFIHVPCTQFLCAPCTLLFNTQFLVYDFFVFLLLFFCVCRTSRNYNSIFYESFSIFGKILSDHFSLFFFIVIAEMFALFKVRKNPFSCYMACASSAAQVMKCVEIKFAYLELITGIS